MYVKDLVDAIIYIWQNAYDRYNYYNIGPSDQTSVKEIAEMVAYLMHCKKIQYTGGDRGWKGDSPHYKVDSLKLLQLGWKPKFTSYQAVELAIKKIIDEQT